MELAIFAAICVVVGLLVVFWMRRRTTKEVVELKVHRITAEELHELMASRKDIRIFDVRQPLDLLANLEIIPGAKRIPPRELRENPSLIPKEKDSVVYCTCPSDKTSREVLHRALDLHFDRIKFLEGGLAAWKSKGYSVEAYRESFHLDTAR